MSSAQSSAARVLPSPVQPASAVGPRTADRLRLVKAPEQARSKVPFILLCIMILGGALLGTLILNIAMNEGAYDARTLQKSIAKEAERSDQLGAQIDALTSPQALAARATALGMIPNSDPGIIRLSDGTIIGGASVAGGGQ